MDEVDGAGPASTGTAPGHVACDAGIRRAFDFLGKRWNGVILGTLSGGATGFAELRRGVGAITDSVLSDRLAELTEAGLVERAVTQTRPPGVLYQLSAAGAQLLPILQELGSWADAALPVANCREGAGEPPPADLQPPH